MSSCFPGKTSIFSAIPKFRRTLSCNLWPDRLSTVPCPSNYFFSLFSHFAWSLADISTSCENTHYQATIAQQQYLLSFSTIFTHWTLHFLDQVLSKAQVPGSMLHLTSSGNGYDQYESHPVLLVRGAHQAWRTTIMLARINTGLVYFQIYSITNAFKERHKITLPSSAKLAAFDYYHITTQQTNHPE